MDKRAILISVVLSFALVGGAVYLRSSSAQEEPKPTQTKSATSEETKPEPKKAEPKLFTTEELAKGDGKNGNPCYVAVDGKVYEIEQGRLWKEGEHTTSQGQAHCGLDLSETITKSPHGKSKLEALEVVGTLKD